jgi:hypothetical protein
MKRNVAMWMAIAGAALLAAFALSLSNKELTPPQAVVEREQLSEHADGVNPELPQNRSTPAQSESSSSKATSLAALDWSAPLKSSLRDAELGIPEAQYRAAVLLRDCRNARMTATDFDRLHDAGLTAEHIRLIQQRVEITGQKQPTAEELDDALRAALEAAGDDRVLRSESFFYVLAAMDKRSNTTGIEADATVRNAWTLLHCREAWDCDLDATMAHLSNELTPVNLRLTTDRAEEISNALKARNWSSVPLN